MSATGLPFLPGCTTDRTLGQTKFHKSQSLSHRNGVMVLDQSKPGIGGAAVPLQKTAPFVTARAGDDGMPAWHSFRSKVLRFTAFFKESVVESNVEQFRVRECTILYYLEDDTVQINELVTSNSGMPQGTLVRRERVLKSGKLVTTFDDDLPPEAYFGPHDFNVGIEVTVYGRTFKITDCDAFTRDYLTSSLGVVVGESGTVPSDPHSDSLKAAADQIRAGRPYKRADTLRQFLDHDQQVLRFYCVWDDTETVFGDKRFMVLHYYLSDDTTEVVEILPPNSGRDKCGAFFGRKKLPKDVKALSKFPGAQTPRTVLNTLGPAVGKNRYILDSTRSDDPSDDVYTDADFAIGNKVVVLGRVMLLCDCDDFTKEHYRVKFGVTEFTPIDVSEPAVAAPAPEIPPSTGFGTEEDSLVSVERLVLTAPKKKLGKHMPRDATPADGSFILRFLGTLDMEDPLAIGREFIISYFLEDDTCSVYEMPKANSGIAAGMFLQRGKYKIPDGSRGVDVEDFKIGDGIKINGYAFVIKDADEYATKKLAEIRSA
mmetsp:Transcript_22970/g.59968  ORF Transcript_22970/g.59968 Transcript_22970/m.59968 type:complete len:542 (+) Transcript_22970:29-1654(+)|eukprot:CAMPEP_0182924604 /NCGR_PEP_ID=MMETSP0105_2-20130417/6788_1 /TAXON_ID=81532 ORGANISM="Acanthoeca-like sp., Strain 10tr" /NCGR_SAMPLE_ID=MMETSP0105_2 /ASSEMBLY_ACC=CAM_ASM_000205 /LENGTH=541 /DNA_ID=CAMNT_0025062399 /DNA_START=29 /DNA_END=1654 /DNA_ORIENTATION=-